MDRRSFLRPLAPPPGAAAPSPPPDPPFEYLPGHFSDPRLPIRWTATQAERPAARPLPGEPLRTQTGLEPFTPSADAPWDRRRALHLLRRTGFGARPADADAVLALTPGAAVDALVNAALAAPLPPAPPWIDEPLPPPDAPDGEVQAYIEANVQWVYDTEHGVYREALGLRVAGTAFRERMTLFWHDHFVTHWEDYFIAPWLHRYWSLLSRRAFGDFRRVGPRHRSRPRDAGLPQRRRQPRVGAQRELRPRTAGAVHDGHHRARRSPRTTLRPTYRNWRAS